MKRFRSAFPAFVSACLAGVLVSAARPQFGGTLRIDTRANIRTLDPAASPADAVDSAVSNRIAPLAFEPLVFVDPAGGLKPLLALSWESEAGGKRWRFRLRGGVRLHDGTPLEPWQVAASLRSVESTWSIAADGDTIVIDLAQPQPSLPWELDDRRHAIAVRRTPTELMGTGPFRLDRIEPGRMLLRAHDAYWSGRPFLDGVQIEMGRSFAAQLTDLEVGRADLIDVQPTDARRLTERGLHVAASRPLDLFALVFEPPKAGASSEPLRRSLARAFERAALCNVLLQGRAEPAETLLPAWITGYAPAFAAPARPPQPRSVVVGLPVEQRTLTLRVEATDPLARSIAERIAVDARESGVLVTVQVPAGLAPRPDVRLVRIGLDATSPDRALARVMAALGPRTVALATAEPAPALGAPIDVVLRVERALLEASIVVPVLRVPELYGVGERVDAWDARPVTATGAWNLASLWLKTPAPDTRVRP
jgi:peptide/nickel transport system substrate-binding protein